MFDFSQFDAYRRANTENRGDHEYCDVEHLLRFWRDAKSQILMPMFGDKLILERSFEYNRSTDELQRQMSDMVDEHREFIDKFTRTLHVQAGNPDLWDSFDEKGQVCRYLGSCFNRLIENVVSLPDVRRNDDWVYLKQYTLELANGNHVNIQNGQKITRMLGQLCKALGLADEWEKFRIAHSLVLNQKKIKGTLCLSIHPLDYATASDNENGWSSCMSWQEHGCYRMGTVEMMNSPVVICSYVKSDKAQMEIDGRPWNSKKWRAWVIVTKDAICTNRQYPYHSDEIATEVIEWVKELCGKTYGWQYDAQVHTDFYGYMEDVMGDGNHIEYQTNYMYNDMGDTDILGVLRADHKGLPGRIMFSGKAECMICGMEILPDTQGADVLECTECFSEYTCYHCGSELNEDEVYYDPDGNAMCYDCWCEHCSTCTDCDDTVWSDYAYHIQFPTYSKRARAWMKKHPDSNVTEYFDHRGWNRLEDAYGTDNTICDNCLRRRGWSDLVYSVDWEDDDKLTKERYGEYTVLDPTKVNKDEYLDWCGVPYFTKAKNQGTNRYNRMTAEDAKDWIDFWYDQYDAFVEDWIRMENAD